MRNLYEVRGEVTAIYLRRKDGRLLEALINTSDLETVSQVDSLWSACQDGNTFYVRCHVYQDGIRTTISMHRLLTDAPLGLMVDHIDRNGLNNQRSNLRLVTNAENGQNRTLHQRNNKSSGVRGVTKTEQGRWRASYILNQQYYHVGIFDTVEEAAEAVRKARLVAYRFSADENQETKEATSR